MSVIFRLKTKDVYDNELYLSESFTLGSGAWVIYPPDTRYRLYRHTLPTERLSNLITLDAEVSLTQADIDTNGWIDGDMIGFIELAAGIYRNGEAPYVYPYETKITNLQYFQAGYILIRLDDASEFKTSCLCKRIDYEYLKEIGETDIYILRSSTMPHSGQRYPTVFPHYREIDFSRSRKLLSEFTEDLDISIVSSDANIISLNTSLGYIEVVEPPTWIPLENKNPASGDQIRIKNPAGNRYVSIPTASVITMSTEGGASTFTVKNVKASGTNVVMGHLSVMIGTEEYFLVLSVSGTTGRLSLSKTIASATPFMFRNQNSYYYIYHVVGAYGYYLVLSGATVTVSRSSASAPPTSSQARLDKYIPGETTEIEYIESKATANAKGTATITTDIERVPNKGTTTGVEEWTIDVVKEESKPKFYYGSHPIKAVQYGSNSPISLKEPSIEPIVENNVLIGTQEV